MWEKYFTQIYPDSENSNSTITGGKEQVTLIRKVEEDGGVSVTYELTVPAHSQAYLELPNVSYINDNSKMTTITIHSGKKVLHSYNVNSKDVGNFYNLGTSEKETKLTVSVSFPENSQVSFGITRFWALDNTKYQAAMDTLILCGADGTLSFDQIYEAGVQPDMVTFTPDSKKILSADEGEPRNGYEAGSIDPKGTVTVIDLTNQNVSHLDFTVFDSEAKRAELVQNGVILKKGTAPSVDLEPEYIAANDI